MEFDPIAQRQLAESRKQSRERARRIWESTPEERKARYEQRKADLLKDRNDSVAGRDIVAEILSHPDPSEIADIHTIRAILFNQPIYALEDSDRLECITNNAYSHRGHVILGAAYPERAGDKGKRMPAVLDAWKMVVCDMRYISEGRRLQEAYETQLREEGLQTPQERARERLRSEVEKMARRNAKWVIPVLENLTTEELTRMEQDDGGDTLAIWKQVSPAPPAWVQHIADTQQAWGFVFYKSRHVQSKFGRRWVKVWETIRQRTYSIILPDDERDLSFANLESIHCRGHLSTLERLWTEHWANVLDLNILADDDALRRHFQDSKESLESPSILRNTFILIDSEPITSDLLREDGFNTDLFWVWAYDSDWKPSSEDFTVDGETYQGRVKVAITCLDAWFYAARYEGVSLQNIWLKAQDHPERVWICYSTPMEPWNHESYD